MAYQKQIIRKNKTILNTIINQGQESFHEKKS